MFGTNNPTCGIGSRAENSLLEGDNKTSAINRVLIVDDEDTILMVITEMLQVLGYSAYATSTLEDAQAAIIEGQANETPFDVAIIDLVLPGIHTGQAINHILKSLSPGLLTVASSGRQHDPAIQVPADYGFSAALPKPYTLADIDGVIKAL